MGLRSVDGDTIRIVFPLLLEEDDGFDAVVQRSAVARVPTEWGEFWCYSFLSKLEGETHLAFVMGDVSTHEPVLARIHSECLTGDVFTSQKCDCGPQLHEAMRRIAEEGRGVVVYMRGHEGRGIGITHKLRAYELQDAGRDTVDANVELGLPVDSRDYGIGALILHDLDIRELRLMTNNPAKQQGLTDAGLVVTERIALHVEPPAEAADYLRTKRDRMGHVFPADTKPA